MGKAQYKKKTQGWRHNPLRVPDAHLGGGKAEGKADPAKEKQMIPVLNKLKSPQHADRTWACAAICNLIQNDAATRRLFQSRNVVGELIERLSDDVDEVVVEASGALRNLAIDGGHELCGEMANKGIMSHLTVLIGKISTTIDNILSGSGSESGPDKFFQERKHLLDLAENVMSLLWSMAEASPKTLQAVNATASESLLVKLLQGRETIGLGVSLAAAQALYSLSQDNFPFRKALITHPTALHTLIEVVQQDHLQAESSQQAKSKKGKGKDKQADGATQDDLPEGRALLRRILISGVLRNCVAAGSWADDKVDISTLTNATILPLVNGLLDVNMQEVCARVLQLVQEIPKQDIAIALGKDLKTDHKSGPELSLERIERSLNTVVTALEVLTNICAGLEDEDDVLEGAEVPETAEEADEDEEMDGVFDDEGLIEQGREPDAPFGDIASNPVVNPGATLSHLLSGLQLPRRLTALSQLTQLSFPPANDTPSPHPPTTSVLSMLHLRALEALNNLLLTTAASIPANASAATQAAAAAAIPMQGIWDAMFATIETIGSEPQALQLRGQEMRVEVLQMALGCVWGIAKIAPAQLSIQPPHIQALIDVQAVLRSELAKTRCIEALSSLASRQNVTIDENRAIGTWLTQQLTSPAAPLSAELLIAVLNAVIDVYADETKDSDEEVFVKGGFLEGLSGIVARVKGEVKKIDRRNDRQTRVRGEEAYENLVAFIKYRRSLLR
ncbi:hypothetical protein IAR55_002522 [Kwoniella newhampshirensis]|uniref:SYO1-like TPR repeats domain-containing protein n=1 Tax=Kwoniella newhampshirensis TaxID=1651941 RepID=A0AAW0Z1Q6_9TREE